MPNLINKFRNKIKQKLTIATQIVVFFAPHTFVCSLRKRRQQPVTVAYTSFETFIFQVTLRPLDSLGTNQNRPNMAVKKIVVVSHPPPITASAFLRLRAAVCM